MGAPLYRSVAAAAFSIAAATGASAAAPGFFDSSVAPILRENCVVCHGGSNPQAELDLRTEASILKGGKSGPGVVPGSAERSLVISKVASGIMPPGDTELSGHQIDTLREWIDHHSEKRVPLVTEKDVLPVFLMRCVTCHGMRRQEAGLDLRTVAGRLKGGNSGPALVPGKPEESLLYQRVVAGEMPPPELLYENNVRPPSEEEVALLRRWIADGARSAPPEPEFDVDNDPLVRPEDRQFWAFLPPERPIVPRVTHADQARNPIDAFLLARLEEKNLGFSPEAVKLTLLRRVYLDLIGMPPTPGEIRAYLEDERSDAYERLVDRLLSSREYGERWAESWLDVAGYSDSQGIKEADRIRPHAWRYRDYVIRSLAEDKPYDVFLTEQLASDELIDYRGLTEVTPEIVNTLAATGFLRLTPDATDSPSNASLAEKFDIIADEIAVLSSAVMGLTVGCARCHDHKYDPIPQRDYYRLSAILQTAYNPYDWLDPTERLLDIGMEQERTAAREHNTPIEAKIKRIEEAHEAKTESLREQVLEDRLGKLPESVREDLRKVRETAGGERTEVQKYLARQFKAVLAVTGSDLLKRFPEFETEVADTMTAVRELKETLKAVPRIRALYEASNEQPPVFVLRRGEAASIGARVQPGVPSVLRIGIEPYRAAPPRPGAASTGARLALARWLTQPNHPLTARVIVNRLWAERFGRGIVPTAANFGHTGERPSHPKLLDWLAVELTNNGWSLKHIHRLMVTSTAYRQTSGATEQVREADPDNLLLSRMPLRRMRSEMLYDSVLRAAGLLDPTPFGPPDPVEVRDSGEVVPTGSEAGFRRAIYLLKRRKSPATILELFDSPRMSPNCTERASSTVAPQALQMRNGDLVRGHARYLAGRLMDEHPDDPKARVEQLYLRVLSRPPTEMELKLGLEDLENLAEEWEKYLETKNDAAPRAFTAGWSALGSLAHGMMSSGEFLYID